MFYLQLLGFTAKPLHISTCMHACRKVDTKLQTFRIGLKVLEKIAKLKQKSSLKVDRIC